jgi:phosphoribosyl 1,2-cyclic phosphodiesterase
MQVRFWGLRGGVPVSGPGSSRYGGNTACIEVRCGDTLIILDGGSGLIGLGKHLMAELGDKPLDARLFLSHAHWDHTMGIPYFLPAFKASGKLTVYGIAGLEEVLMGFFQGAEAGEYFPVPLGRPSVDIHYEELQDVTQVGDASVSYYYLNHPGLTIGFRVEYEGKSIVYITDNESYQGSNVDLVKDDEDSSYLARIDREVVQFARSADLLIADSTYSDEEYEALIGSGHSSVSDALRVALSAGAKKLVLFHHHPLRTDDQIDVLIGKCRGKVERLKGRLEVLAPAEGDTIEIQDQAHTEQFPVDSGE